MGPVEPGCLRFVWLDGEHDDNVASIRSPWQEIMTKWLPSPGLDSAHTPDFEVYDERFDAATGNGGAEIWLGVEPAQ